MTAVEQGADPLWTFAHALSPAARHHYAALSSFTTIPLVRAACERMTPTELARLVGKGIGWKAPANAAGLMLHRLKREAGLLDNDDDQEGGH
jgi:hypothetical protein